MPPSLFPRRPLLRADAERPRWPDFWTFIVGLLSNVGATPNPADINHSGTVTRGRGGGRNLCKSVPRVRAVVTRRAATERGTSGVEGPRLRGLTADRGSGMPTLRLRPRASTTGRIGGVHGRRSGDGSTPPSRWTVGVSKLTSRDGRRSA